MLAPHVHIISIQLQWASQGCRFQAWMNRKIIRVTRCFQWDVTMWLQLPISQLERAGLCSLESTSSGGKSGQQVRTDSRSEFAICCARLVVPTTLSPCCMVCLLRSSVEKAPKCRLHREFGLLLCTFRHLLYLMSNLSCKAIAALWCSAGIARKFCKHCSAVLESSVLEQMVTYWCNWAVFVQLFHTPS